jgi:hypothetical protein
LGIQQGRSGLLQLVGVCTCSKRIVDGWTGKSRATTGKFWFESKVGKLHAKFIVIRMNTQNRQHPLTQSDGPLQCGRPRVNRYHGLRTSFASGGNSLHSVLKTLAACNQGRSQDPVSVAAVYGLDLSCRPPHTPCSSALAIGREFLSAKEGTPSAEKVSG